MTKSGKLHLPHALPFTAAASASIFILSTLLPDAGKAVSADNYGDLFLSFIHFLEILFIKGKGARTKPALLLADVFCCSVRGGQ